MENSARMIGRHAEDTAVEENFTIEDRVRLTKELLDGFGPSIKALAVLEWAGKDGVWTIVMRAALVRQYEALQTILDLVQSKRAHVCVPLLRPAVEEHLWIAFLQTLKSEDREQFLLAKSQVETFQTLEAQWNDAGADAMIGMGFSQSFFDEMRDSSERSKKTLKEIGTRLGWNLGSKSVPSTWFVAQQTGNESLYSLIYHATSRTVHFTVAELLRRGWGNSSRVVIGSEMMDGYWAQFSLYWGGRIFALTFLGLVDEFVRLDVEIDLGDEGETIDVAIRRFVKTGSIRIITPEEMNLHLKEPEKAFRVS